MPGAGAWGPYKRGERFVVLVRAVSGSSGEYSSFASEGAAVRFRDDHRAAISATASSGGRTVAEAIRQYDKHLAEEGHKQRAETIRRLNRFFAPVLLGHLSYLHPSECSKLYDAATKAKALKRAGRKTVAADRPLSASTHRGMLTHAKTFLGWCVSRKWLRSNPLAEVKPKGKAKKGKPQLRFDEARRWYAKALELAATEPGAVAALCTLLMGMRASEITQRQVRDLDDGGRLLWIPDSKTEAGRRTLETPLPLRPFLIDLARNRDGSALLFGGPHLRGWPLFWTKRICALADVPKVSAHAMRGLHATLAMEAGATSHVVAGALGHTSDAVTVEHYAAPGAGAAATQRAAMGVLEGGRKRPRKRKG